MFYRFTSVLLSFFLITSALASSRKVQRSQVVDALAKASISPTDVHAKLNQWSDLKTQSSVLEDKDREVLLKRLEKLEQTPFQKPNLETTPQGLDLVHNKIRIKVDLQKKEISVKDQVFLLEGQNLEKTLRWLESLEDHRTSRFTGIISEAHASAPLIPKAIVLVATVLLYLILPSKKLCFEALSKTKDQVQKTQIECHFASANPREVPPSLKALTKKSLTITGRLMSCEETLKDTFSYWSSGLRSSCLPEKLMNELCQSMSDIQNCLNQLQGDRAGLKINSSGREIKKDQLRSPRGGKNSAHAIQH